MTETSSGFVALVGRPNVGKSTLLNSLVGAKIAITSARPETTRNRILAILNRPGSQLIFLDTPGVHKPRHKLGEYMLRAALKSLTEVDVICFVADATARRGAGENFILSELAKVKKPVVLVINKLDLLKDKKQLLKISADYSAAYAFTACLGCAALTGEGVAELAAALEQILPAGPRLYPEDVLTDQAERVIAAEIVREKILRLTRDEVPHAVAVTVEEFKERARAPLYIRAVIYVERASQKAIVIGAQGAMLKAIGQAARQDLEKLLAAPVYLDLWVKVKTDWRNAKRALAEFGYQNS